MNYSRNNKLLLLRRHKKLAMIFALLLALWLGYQLAHIESDKLTRINADQAKTIQGLNDENHKLTQQLNQQKAKQTLCAAELDQVAEQQLKVDDQLASCHQEVALFKHVMAPELSGAMLAVEIVSINKASTDSNVYMLDLLLLQPRLQKAVVSGTLDIHIDYLTGTSQHYSLPYKFKFFQQDSVELAITENKTPQTVRFYSDIFQYGRKREVLEQVVPWDEALTTYPLAPK